MDSLALTLAISETFNHQILAIFFFKSMRFCISKSDVKSDNISRGMHAVLLSIGLNLM